MARMAAYAPGRVKVRVVQVLADDAFHLDDGADAPVLVEGRRQERVRGRAHRAEPSLFKVKVATSAQHDQLDVVEVIATVLPPRTGEPVALLLHSIAVWRTDCSAILSRYDDVPSFPPPPTTTPHAAG